MSRLNQAQDRLERALVRLEKVSTGPVAADPALAHELEELRQRHARLESHARTVSERLDSAINRMKSMVDD